MKSVGASGLSRKLLLYAVMCAKHMFDDYIKYEHDVKSNGLMQLGCTNQPSAKNHFDAIDFFFLCSRREKRTNESICYASARKKKAHAFFIFRRKKQVRAKHKPTHNMNKFIWNMIVGKWELFTESWMKIESSSYFIFGACNSIYNPWNTFIAW